MSSCNGCRRGIDASIRSNSGIDVCIGCHLDINICVSTGSDRCRQLCQSPLNLAPVSVSCAAPYARSALWVAVPLLYRCCTVAAPSLYPSLLRSSFLPPFLSSLPLLPRSFPSPFRRPAGSGFCCLLPSRPPLPSVVRKSYQQIAIGLYSVCSNDLLSVVNTLYTVYPQFPGLFNTP